MLKKGEVKMIHKMIKEGLSKSAIARKLGLSRDMVWNDPYKLDSICLKLVLQYIYQA